VAVFDARNVAAEKAGGLLDIALAEILFFAQSSESLTYLHGESVQQNGRERQRYKDCRGPFTFAAAPQGVAAKRGEKKEEAG
jgi:hypothetical protein